MNTKRTTRKTVGSQEFPASTLVRAVAAAFALFGISAALAHAAAAAEGSQVLEGRMSQLTGTQVTIDDTYSFRFDPATAQCFDFRGSATTCDTLIGIGYAQRARLTISGDTAVRIDLLELQQ
jgi:hypothetical protein